MGKFDGRVAFITGAARGQGRSHAVRLAQEGADLIVVDVCRQMATNYPGSNPEDLQETANMVEELGRRIVARQADVRSATALQAIFDEGTDALGPVTIVIANAGITAGGAQTSVEHHWDEVIGINLTGVWNTGRIAIPSMIEQGKGGAIVLTSSAGGLAGIGLADPGALGYTAAKFGMVGLMRSWANYLAPHNIRVSIVAPTAVRTIMATHSELSPIMQMDPRIAQAFSNPMGVDMVEPADVTNAIEWLVSDDARYVTGSVIPVDAGFLNKR